jgi:caspase 7
MAKMYKMDHPKRGTALVINIKTYDPNPYKLEEREWSEKDVKNLKKTLKHLEFKLKSYENLKANEIRKKIQKIAKLDHTNSDCFLCVVMSHGSDDRIVASDSEEISLKEIMQPFKTSCESLENKPKLFFFQACRGVKKMVQLVRPDSGISNTNKSNPTDTKNKTTTLDQSTKKDSESNLTKIEAEADLLVYYATLPEHYAYGNKTNEGTIFIESVCTELNEAYKNLPNNILLSAMILNINKRVRESGLELADPINRLMAEVNFTPKNVS